MIFSLDAVKKPIDRLSGELQRGWNHHGNIVTGVKSPWNAQYSAQFPPELRYSGLSLGIQIAAALGGGLAPIVATELSGASGGLVSVGAYLATLGVLAVFCAWLMRAPSATVAR